MNVARDPNGDLSSGCDRRDLSTLAVAKDSGRKLDRRSTASRLNGRRVPEVCADDFLCGANVSRFPLEVERPVAQVPDGLQIVGDEHDGDALIAERRHPLHAAALEGRIPDAQDFVDDEDVRLEVRRDGESEPRVHAG